MTTANGSPITPTTGAPGGNSRATPWTPAVRAEHRAGRARERPGPSRAADIQTELREAASAAAEAADRARVLAALLDEALAALSDARVAPHIAWPRQRRPPCSGLTYSAGANGKCWSWWPRGGRTKRSPTRSTCRRTPSRRTSLSLLHKLQADSRVQLAVIAIQHGLP